MSGVWVKDQFQFTLRNNVVVSVETEGSVWELNGEPHIDHFCLGLGFDFTRDYKRTLDCLIAERGDIEDRAADRLIETALEEGRERA